jgi:hypothetical protein
MAVCGWLGEWRLSAPYKKSGHLCNGGDWAEGDIGSKLKDALFIEPIACRPNTNWL